MVSPAENDYRAFVTGQSSDEEAVRQIDQFNFPNRKRLSNTLTVIDTRTLEVVETYAVGVEPLAMAITPDGKKVYVANAGTGTETFELIPSNSVSIVDTETKEVKTIEIGNSPTHMVMTPDGRKVYVTHSGTSAAPGHFVSVIEVETDVILPAAFELTNKPSYLTASPDGAVVLVANTGTTTEPGNAITLIDVANDVSRSIPTGTMPVGIAVVQEVDDADRFISASEGNRIFVANSGDNTVSVIEAVDFGSISTIEAPSKLIEVGENPTALAVSRDGTILYVANSGVDGSPGNSVTIVEAATGKILVNNLPVTETKNASPIGILVENDSTAAASDRHKAFAINNFSVSIIEETARNTFSVTNTIYTAKTGPTKLASIQSGSANGPILFAASALADRVYMIDPKTDSFVSHTDVGSTPVDLVINETNDKLLIANSGLQRTFGDSVTIVDIAAAKINPDEGSVTILLSCFNAAAPSIPVECRPTSIAINNDSAYIANFGVSSGSDANQDIASYTIAVIDIGANKLDAPIIKFELLAPLRIAIDKGDVNTVVDDRLYAIVDGFSGDIVSISLNDRATVNGDPLIPVNSVDGGTFIDIKLLPPSIGPLLLSTSFFVPTPSSTESPPDGFDFPPQGILFTSNDEFNVSGNPTSIQYSETKERVYVISSGTLANPDNLLTIFQLDATVVTSSQAVEVGQRPIDIAVFEDTDMDKVFVANFVSNTISVLEISNDNLGITILSDSLVRLNGFSAFDAPIDIEVVEVADGQFKAYVANSGNNTISVIDVETDAVVGIIDLE
jgi:YVTN family beta-propeller protein